MTRTGTASKSSGGLGCLTTPRSGLAQPSKARRVFSPANHPKPPCDSCERPIRGFTPLPSGNGLTAWSRDAFLSLQRPLSASDALQGLIAWRSAGRYIDPVFMTQPSLSCSSLRLNSASHQNRGETSMHLLRVAPTPPNELSDSKDSACRLDGNQGTRWPTSKLYGVG